MIKVAIFSCGDLSNMKGVMNFVHEKAKRFLEIEDVSCDLYIIRSVQSRLFSFVANGFKFSLLFGKKNAEEETTTIDGVIYHNLWHTYSLWDNLFNTKLLKRPQGRVFTNRCVKIFRSYDIIATHDISCHFIAGKVYRKHGVPYVATWHGSDINLAHEHGKKSLQHVRDAIETASCNLFVSKALLNASNKITTQGRKEVIYTGPSAIFERYSDDERQKLRAKFHVEDKKVVAFVGNLFPIKNVLILPDIFKKVESAVSYPIEFWIIGDGKLESPLRKLLMESGVNFKMLGKKQPNEMPEYMNVIDVLVLPSLNEGLPWVTLEAQKCGAHVVGSNVGGISESIGKDNVFNLDNDFVKNVAQRIVDLLNTSTAVVYPQEFSWENAVEKECAIYKQVLYKDSINHRKQYKNNVG